MLSYILALVVSQASFDCPNNVRGGVCKASTGNSVTLQIMLRANIVSAVASSVSFTEVLEGSGIYKMKTVLAYSGCNNGRSESKEFLVVDERGKDNRVAFVVNEINGEQFIEKMPRVRVSKWSESREALAINRFHVKQKEMRDREVAAR